MKILSSFLFLSILVYACKQKPTFKPQEFSKVEVETLLLDTLLDVRAIELISDKNIVFATADGWIGKNDISDLQEIVELTKQLKYDSIVPNFRSIAISSNDVFVLSIASPALLYKITSDTTKLVYIENNPKVFYDSMDFWNDKEGIAIGDSTDGCLSVIITRDGGNTWTKLSCDMLPKGLENEGAFAASDSNIAIVDDNTWVATTAGRVYYSPDKGTSWEVFDTPIIKDEETQGIYSIDFYDELHGFAIGGDYTKPDDNTENKIVSNDGGKTWQLVAQKQNPGYRSCVQYIPNREGKELVAIGFKGIDYSNDGGYNWKHLSDEGFYTLRFLNDSTAYASGQGRISRLTFKE